MTCGRCSRRRAFVSGLHVTPDDMIARSDERSQRSGCASSAESSGRGEHVADEREDLHRVALHLVPDDGRIEALAVDQDDRPAAGERREAGPEAGAVHQGARGQHGGRPLAGADRRDRIGRLAPRAAHLPQRDVEVVVAPHDALGQTGRSAGVEEDQVVAVGWARRRVVDGYRRVEGRLVRRADLEGHGPAGGGDALHRGEHGLGELGCVHDGARFGVLEDVAGLVGDVAIVDVHGRAPELQCREHGLEVLGPVRDVDRDLVARLQAGVAEPRRQPRRVVVEIAPTSRRVPHTRSRRASGTSSAIVCHTVAKLQPDIGRRGYGAARRAGERRSG